MKRILLADDHSYIRMGLIQLLKDELPFAEIGEAADGQILVKKVLESDWDLVISDLEMPGLNGLEALEQIKKVKPDLPVLILSIYDEQLYAVRALKAGAVGYLNKNAAPDELVQAIRRIQTGKKYISPDVAELLLQSNDERKLHENLTNRELSIFKLLAKGASISQIAAELFLAPTTVSTYRSRILEKLNLNTNADLTRYALQHHLISDLLHTDPAE
jgi:DNA-binding NarL/FixJ family response regulator